MATGKVAGVLPQNMKNVPHNVTVAPEIKKKLQDPAFTMNNLYRIVNKNGYSIPFKLNWAQKDMFENMHNRNIILKARQIGSTTFWCIYFLNKALWQSNQRLGIISYNLTSAHDIFGKIIKHAYKNLPTKVSWLPQLAVVKDSAREIEFANGSSIRVDTNMRSGTLSGLLITEFGKICARYPQKAEEIMTGSINTVATSSLCVIESTAEGSAGQFYEMWQSAKKNDIDNLNELQWKPFFYPWHKHSHEYSLERDNIIHPKYLLDYYQSLHDQHGILLSEAQKNWYSMKYNELGEQIKQEYPSTDTESFMVSNDGYWYLRELNEARQEKRITTVPYQPQVFVYSAWDLGYRDSTAIWFFQVMPSGAIHVIDYYENSGEGLHHYAAHVNTLPYKDMIKTHYMPHDAAAHDIVSGLSVAKQAKELGLNIEILNRFTASRSKFMLEVQRCRTLIKRCYFDESKTAVGLKCLENYRKRWNESMACYTDEPVHDWASHGCFIGETLIKTTKGDKQIKNIKEGDFVITPFGTKKVLKKFKYETDEIYEINGNLKCTGNHKIFTKKGLKHADTLRYHDKIICYDESNPWKKYINMVGNIGFREAFTLVFAKDMYYTKDTIGDGTVSTTKAGETGGVSRLCIGMCGLKTLVKSLKGTIFTIKTIIQETMKYPTYNVCPSMITCHYQQKIANGLEVKKIKNNLYELKKKLKSGMHQKQVENGINRTGKSVGKTEKKYRRSAWYVKKHIKHYGKENQNFAVTIAKQYSGEIQEKIMKSAVVKDAKKIMNVINTVSESSVVKIVRKNEKQIVYDIEVESDHCYFANNYLVSNSDSFRYMAQAIETMVRRPDQSQLELERKKIQAARRRMV